jgi:hypothetical protein
MTHAFRSIHLGNMQSQAFPGSGSGIQHVGGRPVIGNTDVGVQISLSKTGEARRYRSPSRA